MENPESLKELADVMGAEADQLIDVLRSAIAGVPPVVALEQRVARVERALPGAEVLRPLCDKLDALQEVAGRAGVLLAKWRPLLDARKSENRN